MKCFKIGLFLSALFLITGCCTRQPVQTRHLQHAKIFNHKLGVNKMPLIKGTTKKDREKNVAEMIKAGHKPAQAEAAAYSIQRKAQNKNR